MPRYYERKTQKAKWTEEQLQKAIYAIQQGAKIRETARTYGIHEATLRTRMKAGDSNGPALGRKPTFTVEHEKELAQHIIIMAKLFYGVSCIQLRRLAFEYAEANKITNNFDKSSRLAGKDWLSLFLKRNPEISLRKPEATSINRIQAFNQVEVDEYFKNLNEVFEKYKFRENRIFNVDETGINTVQKPERILAPKGVKQIGGATSWERGKNVTVICCFSAAGTYVSPMFIFPRKRMSPLLSKGGPVGAKYGCSFNGWSNEALFFEWIQHFQNNVKSSIEDPTLLVLDNHSSHISLEIFNFCKQHGIVMVTIPPHTSHKLQPLDVAFFSSLKAAFNRECDLFIKSRVYEKITPYELAELFHKAYVKVATMDKGNSGFKSCGIWPYNPDKFKNIDYEHSASYRNIFLEDDESLTQSGNGTDESCRDNMTCLERSRAQDQLPGSSKECVPIVFELQSKENSKTSAINLNEQTHVRVSDISPIPNKMKSNSHKNLIRGRPKGKSVILTATPEKSKLETQLSIRLKKEQEAVKNKYHKIKILKPKLQGVTKKKKKTVKKKLILDESSSEEDVDLKDICNDNELDDIDINVDVCLVCGEFGKDGEIWFRCVICSGWSHEDCSGWDSPENYKCDVCISRESKK